MPVDVALNIALRNIVRRDLAPVAQVLPPLDDDPEQDTDEEAQNRFRSAGVLPTKREAQADERSEAVRRRRRAQLPGGIGHQIGFSTFTLVPGTGLQASVAGPFGFPFTIEEVTFNFVDTDVVGASNLNFFSVLVGTSADATEQTLRGDTNVVLAADAPVAGFNFIPFNTLGGSQTELSYPIGRPIFSVPSFIKILANFAGIGFIRAGVQIREGITSLPSFGALFTPPVGRTTINVNTRAPRTRTRRAPVPRAAVISVRQGGTIINQRTVAWQSLAPRLRADWFNRQVGGAADPNLQWIP